MSNRSDNFNRADGSIGTPSDGGAAWSVLSGTWNVISNQAQEANNGSQRICVLEASSAIADVQVTFATKGNDDGLCGRVADDNNYILAQTGVTSNIYKRVAGAFTSIATSATGLASNDVLKLTIDASNLISLIKNGTTLASVTDSAGSTNTKHGMRANGSNNTRFEDFSITDNGGGSTPSIQVPMLLVPTNLSGNLSTALKGRML